VCVGKLEDWERKEKITVSFYWCLGARKQSRDIPVDARFLCDNLPYLRDRIVGTLFALLGRLKA
jgi:hypothetical protein